MAEHFQHGGSLLKRRKEAGPFLHIAKFRMMKNRVRSLDIHRRLGTDAPGGRDDLHAQA